MTRLLREQKGLASLEMALIVPVIAALLYVLVEGGNTIRTYTALVEASRAAARQVVLTGNDSTAQDFVRSMSTILAPQGLTATVTRDNANRKVTVEVRYGYRSIFNSNPYTGDPNDALYSLAARTSMPLP